MKKRLFYLIALICSVSLFTSCSDDDDEIQSPVGETTFTDANGLALTYSGQPMIGKQVQFTPQGAKAVITLSSAGFDLSGLVRSTGSPSSGGILPGQGPTTLNVDLNINGDKATFEGTGEHSGHSIAYKGEVSESSMKLDLNVTAPTNALSGTSWNLIPLSSKDPTVPMHIKWESTHSVQMEGLIKSMILPMIKIKEVALPKYLSAILGKVTFLPDGNIQAEYKNDPADEAFKTSPLNIAMYTVANNQVRVHLNLSQIMAISSDTDTRASLEEALPELITFLLPMLTTGVPVSYAQEGDNMTFYLGYDVLAPILNVAARLMEDEELKATVIEFVREKAGPAGGIAVMFVTQILNQLSDIVAATSDVQIGIDMIAAE